MVQKSMSKLEQEVMAIIWKCKSCSVRDVMAKLSNTRLAYTTVATILQRLYKKGIVARKGQGVSFIYLPKVTKETYAKKLAQLFVKNFYYAFNDTAIVSFAESIETLPKAKKSYFLKLLQDKNESK